MKQQQRTPMTAHEVAAAFRDAAVTAALYSTVAAGLAMQAADVLEQGHAATSNA